MAIDSNLYCQTIGKTPLINISNLVKPDGAKLLAKCEYANPGMSLKDRIASHMIHTAINNGQLKSGDTLVCASSGNTGCSVAMIGSMLGIKVIVVTSAKCSEEKQNHIKAYGAELMIMPDTDYMAKASELAIKHGYFDINQYSNPANPEAYYKTLGPEIWQETQGKVSHFVMTGSTFGCISGTGRYLKEQNAEIRVILADPDGSNMHDYYYKSFKENDNDFAVGAMKPFIIEGAGKSKPTPCLNFNVIDDVVKVNDQEAINMCYKLANTNGLLVGGSSGLNVHAAVEIANSLTSEHIIVTLLCDNGVKYLSKIFNSRFLTQNNIKVGAAQTA
ncbi:cysteine synthase family protein [Aliikangiella marina]|uniref:cysteine synthase n=1 Tax=Aliikangiella marina TaxID=1712262 RepID=A0A545TJG7_9GAMM|nr:cysteine synthase family protein [Aliikangiella marina]TQV77365.1 cysteine synthase family protein [Aliikangiella marina]